MTVGIKPRVMVLEHSKQDVSCASDFGNLLYVFPSDGTRCSIWQDRLHEIILSRMETLRYDPANDYLAVTGPMVLQVIVIGTLVARYKNIRVLLYDAISKQYVARTIGEHYNAG